MWDYSDKVRDYFFNPRNAGVLPDANAVGEAGSLSCGDALKLMLRVNPLTDVIEDARFQAFGCGSAIASSSVLTEMVIGRTVDEALELTNQDIAAVLDGLPPAKMRCSAMGQDALKAALAAWRGEAPTDQGQLHGGLVCKCHAVPAAIIARAIRTLKLTSLEQVTLHTGAGGNCTACREPLEEVLSATHARMVEAGELAAAEAFVLDPAKARPKRIAAQFVSSALARKPAPQPITIAPPVAPQPQAPDSSVREAILIARLVEEARPSIRADGGDVELLDYDGSAVFVSLSGACAGCSAAALTLGGLRQKIVQALGRQVRVMPVSKS